MISHDLRKLNIKLFILKNMYFNILSISKNIKIFLIFNKLVIFLFH